MDDDKAYWAKLEKEANRVNKVLRVLKRYQKLGEQTFSDNLHEFLCFNINFFQDDKHRQMLRNVILDIRQDITRYNERRDQVNGAIRDMESKPKLQVNPFARNMYVKILGGNYWVENYKDDVYIVLQALSDPDVNDF
jgi:hypothetical protein